MEKVEKALNLFRSGYNCSQGVLAAFSSDLGLDERSALKVSGSFGGGMGRLQGTCGAVSGAFMVLGLKYGQDEPKDTATKDKNYAVVRQFNELFVKKHGSTNCRELLDVNLMTPEGQKGFLEQGLGVRVCQACIASAVEILEGILEPA